MPADRAGRHGAALPRGLGAGRSGRLEGRFGRMFPGPACAAGEDEIEHLVAAMERRTQPHQNQHVPAGFTYLGQFVDHDITFDATTSLEGRSDPHALVNFRTPRFDLDSVYGAGPVVQPYLYDWRADPPGTKLLIGSGDLPRNDQGRALIGDARNDENAIVAQLHLLFLRFHNAVVARLGPDATLEAAQRIVRRHYQWIVAHELLDKVAGETLRRRVLPDDGPVRREHFRGRRFPYIPVEFSAAAYRFGHSMVRNEYGLRRHPPSKDAEAPLPIFPELAGFRPLTPERTLDWERFFRLPGHGLEAQASFRIDTTLAEPLYRLPDGDPKLARRNLLRGRALGLPPGPHVARAIGAPALSEAELMIDADLPDGVRRTLLRSTPLWYYVLAEAEREPEEHLGPVGGLIVGEVLAGLLEADPSSFLHEPGWRPDLGEQGDFTMADLVRVAREHGSDGVRR